MPEHKAHNDDRLGRFREIVMDPNNCRIPRVEYAGFVYQDKATGSRAVVMHNGIGVLLDEHAATALLQPLILTTTLSPTMD